MDTFDGFNWLYFAITLRNIRQISSFFFVIIRNNLSFKTIKAFPTTIQLYYRVKFVKLVTLIIIPILPIFEIR